MFTNDRLDALATRYGLMATVPLARAYAVGLHEVLNLFDIAAGLDTSGGILCAPIGRNGVIGANPIGTRLTMHERPGHVPETGPKQFHWLGYDACCSCGCGEHRRM